MKSFVEPERGRLLSCLAFAIVLTLACGWFLQHLLVQVEARSWPTMKTAVKSVAIYTDRSRRPPSFAVTVVHEFSTHAGTVRSADVLERTTNEAEALALAARCDAGTRMDMHFRPDDPSMCRFAAGASTNIGGFFPFSLAMVTALMWWSFFGQLRGFRLVCSAARPDTFQPPPDVRRE